MNLRRRITIFCSSKRRMRLEFCEFSNGGILKERLRWKGSMAGLAGIKG